MLTELVLKDAGLSDIPQLELSAFTNFTLLDFSNTSGDGSAPVGLASTPNLVANASQECFYIPRCLVPGVTCNLPLPVCGAPETGGSLTVTPGVMRDLEIAIGVLVGFAVFFFCCYCVCMPRTCAQMFRVRQQQEEEAIWKKSDRSSKRMSISESLHSDWEALRVRFYLPSPSIEFFSERRPKKDAYEEVDEKQVSVEGGYEVVFDRRRGTHEAGPVSPQKPSARRRVANPEVSERRPQRDAYEDAHQKDVSVEGGFELVFDRRRGTHEAGPISIPKPVSRRRVPNSDAAEHRVVTFAEDEPHDV
jgi:hypothetical protein